MQMAEIGGVSLRSQQQYEKGNVAPTTDYLTRLYEAGFDVVYLITGKRNTETLTAEDSELLRVWYQAEPILRKIAWRVLTTDGDLGGDPEVFFKVHRDKTDKTDTGIRFFMGVLLLVLAIVFAQLSVLLFPGQAASSPQAVSVYIVTVAGICMAAIGLVASAMNISLRNSWLLLPVYQWCRYNLIVWLWRNWRGDADGEGRKAKARIDLWHAFHDRETAKERHHIKPTKRRKSKMERLEARWQEMYRHFLAEYGYCAPCV